MPGPGLCTERETTLVNWAATPSRAVMCAWSFSLIFLVFSFLVLDSSSHNGPNCSRPSLGHLTHRAQHHGVLAAGTQIGKAFKCWAIPKHVVLSRTIGMNNEQPGLLSLWEWKVEPDFWRLFTLINRERDKCLGAEIRCPRHFFKVSGKFPLYQLDLRS